jgi:hypothetical protein
MAAMAPTLGGRTSCLNVAQRVALLVGALLLFGLARSLLTFSAGTNRRPVACGVVFRAAIRTLRPPPQLPAPTIPGTPPTTAGPFGAFTYADPDVVAANTCTTAARRHLLGDGVVAGFGVVGAAAAVVLFANTREA